MAHGTDLNDEEIRKVLDDDTPNADFAEKFIGDVTVRHIAIALTDNVSKTSLFLDRNCVGADGAAALGNLLKVGGMCNITGTQSLSGNISIMSFVCAGVPTPGSVFKGPHLTPSPRCLARSPPRPRYCTSSYLACRFQVDSSISTLSLEWNNIGTFEEGVQLLCDGLELNKSLATLKLCNNHISAQVRVSRVTTRRENGSGS